MLIINNVYINNIKQIINYTIIRCMFQIFHTIILNYKLLHLKYDLDKEYNLIIIIDVYDVYPSVYLMYNTNQYLNIESSHYNIEPLQLQHYWFTYNGFIFIFLHYKNKCNKTYNYIIITIIILLYKSLLLIKINNAKYTLY